MKLLKLELSDLFGRFNHAVEFNQDERITILTAPNGYGKTITLKIIYNLFNRKFNFFNKLSFKKIVFFFDDNKKLEISKLNNAIKFNLKEGNKKISEFKLNKLNKNDIERLDRYLPHYISRIGQDTWINEREDELLLTEDIIERFGNHFPIRIKSVNYSIPKEIDSIIDSIEVYLIQEQRLVIRQPQERRRIKQSNFVDAIKKHSEGLKHLIIDTTNEYAENTQSLDSSFPKRLFENNINIQEEELDKRLSELEYKQKRISEFGLLTLEEDAFLQKKEIKNEDKKVLSLYISDSEKKLSVFDSLVDGIELFTKILNERRFSFKNIKIDKEKGFVFKTQKGEALEPTELSSGEQHEVVLLFELLFNAKENSLVLIDEPEISLHVDWQREFLDDIKEIIKLRKIDIVIATHSPQIINKYWDLTINYDE